MKTFLQHRQDIDNKWIIVDAEGVVLSSAIDQCHSLWRGKHKLFHTHMDGGGQRQSSSMPRNPETAKEAEKTSLTSCHRRRDQERTKAQNLEGAHPARV